MGSNPTPRIDLYIFVRYFIVETIDPMVINDTPITSLFSIFSLRVR
ncbi:MAG: hypothetical protein LM581_02540 [Desulfurococcales archaeon]|nr:hypothetical protein [Desulfurococcales archaeon]